MIKKLSFGKRIYLGFGSITFLIVIIALVASNRIQKVKELDMLYRKLLSIEKILMDMHNNNKDFLLHEPVNKVFFISGKSIYVDNFTQDHNELTQLLEEVQESRLLPQDSGISANTITASIDNYYNTFLEIVEKYKLIGHKDLGLQGKFNNEAQEFESAIKQKKDLNIELSYLTLSTYEKDFLLYKDTIYVAAFNTLAQQVLLNTSGDLKQSAAKYIEGFNKVVDLTKKIGLTENDGLNQILGVETTKIKTLVNKLKPKLEAEIQTYINHSIILFFSVIVISFLIVVRTSTRIISDVKEQLGGEPSEVFAITREIANGNLAVQFDTNRKKTGVYEALYDMSEKLKEIASSIISASENIASAGQQVSSSSQYLSQGVNEQAASVEELSSSVEQISGNIQLNTENALRTENISKNTMSNFHQSTNSVNKSILAMKDIAGKITIIGDIAFQTNILALNAAVEAARAGEHGKGFAVVASEVRKLAEGSRSAADEINSLSKNSVQISENAGLQFSSLVPEMERTIVLVREISQASQEQNQGIGQINIALHQLNQITQQNAAVSEEMATSAEEMASQAEELKGMISFFKVD